MFIKFFFILLLIRAFRGDRNAIKAMAGQQWLFQSDLFSVSVKMSRNITFLRVFIGFNDIFGVRAVYRPVGHLDEFLLDVYDSECQFNFLLRG